MKCGYPIMKCGGWSTPPLKPEAIPSSLLSGSGVVLSVVSAEPHV